MGGDVVGAVDGTDRPGAAAAPSSAARGPRVANAGVRSRRRGWPRWSSAAPMRSSPPPSARWPSTRRSCPAPVRPPVGGNAAAGRLWLRRIRPVAGRHSLRRGPAVAGETARSCPRSKPCTTALTCPRSLPPGTRTAEQTSSPCGSSNTPSAAAPTASSTDWSPRSWTRRPPPRPNWPRLCPTVGDRDHLDEIKTHQGGPRLVLRSPTLGRRPTGDLRLLAGPPMPCGI